MLSVINNKNQPLSRRFVAAYSISKEASPSDTSESVKNARKALRSMKKEFQKKKKEMDDVCEAASIVGIPQRRHLCSLAGRVRHDHMLLQKELARIKRK